MRVAFLIPHCFKGDNESSTHGSSWTGARTTRAQVVDRAISQIHSLWGSRYRGLEGNTLRMFPGGNPYAVDFGVFVFTTQGLHLLDELKTRNLFQHVETDAEPMLLGFECARWIKENLGRYDYFFYLEDDILIHDPLFLRKVDTFNQRVAAHLPKAMLQPQRYELALHAEDPRVIGDIDRLYIDYILPDWTPADAPPISINFLGMQIEFEPARNPHSGCYLISNAQAELIAAHPDFMVDTGMFDLSLDTAATSFIAQALIVYKSTARCLSFLEVQHGHQVCLRS